MDLEGHDRSIIYHAGMKGSSFFMSDNRDYVFNCYCCGDLVTGNLHQAVIMIEFGYDVEFKDIEGMIICDDCHNEVKNEL